MKKWFPLLLIAFVVLATACQKTKLLEVDRQFVGLWHTTSLDTSLEIDDFSEGKYVIVKPEASEVSGPCRVKGNTLHLKKLRFEINQYPTKLDSIDVSAIGTEREVWQIVLGKDTMHKLVLI